MTVLMSKNLTSRFAPEIEPIHQSRRPQDYRRPRNPIICNFAVFVADDVHHRQHQEYPAEEFHNVQCAFLDAPFFVRRLVLVGAEHYHANHADGEEVDDEVVEHID